MPDEPPQAIHGLLSASPGRNAALAIRCRCFFQQPKIKSRRGRDPDLCGFNRSADGYVKVSRVLAAGGRDKRAMDGARPTQDRMSCGGKSGSRPSGRGVPPEPARLAWFLPPPTTNLPPSRRESETTP